MSQTADTILKVNTPTYIQEKCPGSGKPHPRISLLAKISGADRYCPDCDTYLALDIRGRLRAHTRVVLSK